MKRLLGWLGLIVFAGLVVGLLVFYVLGKQADAPGPRNINNNVSSEESAPEETTDNFDSNMYSTDEPGSMWWVVNKTRPLPDGYVPPDLVVPNVRLRLSADAEQMLLRRDVAKQLERMLAAAEVQGISLYLASGYRSAAYQKQLYDAYVARDGQAAADRYSARPGTSEHQTGLAADVGRPDGKCELEVCFGETAEGKWVADNAHRYGFIVRYPAGKENVTTYQYEPWHLRYVGPELAKELLRTQLTLEEYFGI